MSKMEKEFIPYEQALELKELEFNETCFGWYQSNKLKIEKHPTASCEQTYMRKEDCFAPTFSQAFRWFREKYNIFGNICFNQISCKGYYIVFGIMGKTSDSTDYFETYEEAELECLKKLIEIVKEK